MTDLVYASWTFLELGHSNSLKNTERQIEEISMLIDAYGEIDVTDFVDELLQEQKKILKYRKKRILKAENENDKDQRASVYNEIIKQIEWTENNRKLINKRIS